jgi:AcrR family transcriptional regulator
LTQYVGSCLLSRETGQQNFSKDQTRGRLIHVCLFAWGFWVLPNEESPVASWDRIGPREQVRDMQRRRLLDAMAHVLAEKGSRGVTIGLVAEGADVSPATFRKLFTSLEDCFVVLVEQVTKRSTVLVGEAFGSAESWQDGVLVGLEALLTFLDSEPILARVCLIESLAGPPEALRRRARLLESLKPLLDRAREQLPADCQPPPATADAIIAAVSGICHARLVEGSAPPFMGLLGELAGVVVVPFLGMSQAARAIERGNTRSQVFARGGDVRPSDVPVPIPRAVRHGSAHRIRLALAYLAENPGASNQAVAVGIDLTHHGQMSRALSRLEQLGLLIKRSGSSGHPNAWWLSPHGERVLRALDYR